MIIIEKENIETAICEIRKWKEVREREIGQKERATAGRKENRAPPGDKRDDKRNKGHERGTNKAETKGKEV